MIAQDFPPCRIVHKDRGRTAAAFDHTTVYQFDPQGDFVYYYAHLDRYADGLHEGLALRRGQPIGTVGATGNARPDAPHLHFAILRLGSQREWWKGTPVNPYPHLARALATAPR